MYIPPITFTYKYPEIQDQHMMKVVEKYQPKLDETYTYRVRSFGWRFRHFWLNVLLNTIVLPVVVIRYAVKHKVPLIPIAISYRKPRGLYKLFKKYPNLTVNIGEPLFPNHQLNRKDAEKELIKNARCCVMKMMRIKDEEENKKVMGMYKGSRHPFSYNKES